MSKEKIVFDEIDSHSKRNSSRDEDNSFSQFLSSFSFPIVPPLKMALIKENCSLTDWICCHRHSLVFLHISSIVFTTKTISFLFPSILIELRRRDFSKNNEQKSELDNEKNLLDVVLFVESREFVRQVKMIVL